MSNSKVLKKVLKRVLSPPSLSSVAKSAKVLESRLWLNKKEPSHKVGLGSPSHGYTSKRLARLTKFFAGLIQTNDRHVCGE